MERACLHCMLHHGKLQRKSVMASGRSVMCVVWLWTEREGWRMDVGQLDPVGPWWRCGGLITIYFSVSVKHLLTCRHRCGTYIYVQ